MRLALLAAQTSMRAAESFEVERAKYRKNAAVFACFLFSALLHELLVSIPFHMPRLYAFGAMLGQIPLVQVTKILEERWSLWKEVQAGNITFWISFCIVGQPMAVLLYYYDAHSMHHQVAAGVPQLEVVGSAVVSAAGSAVGSVTTAAADLLRYAIAAGSSSSGSV